MGSFNTFCAVTKQIITPGEEVYLIPVVKQIDSRKTTCVTRNEKEISFYAEPSLVYNTDLYKPFGVMFTAEYGDYGRFDLDDTVSNLTLLQVFTDNLVENMFDVQLGENEYHEKAFTKNMLEERDPTILWETLTEGFRSNRIVVYGNYRRAPSNLHLVAVTKRHMDTTLNWFYNQNTERMFYRNDEEQLAFWEASLEDKYKLFLKDLKEREGSFTFESKYNIFLRSQECNTIVGSFVYEEIFFDSYKKNGINEKQLELFKQLLDLSSLYSIFNRMNITLQPVWYATQDYCNTTGFLFSILMNTVYKENLEKQLAFLKDYSEGDYTLLSERELIEKTLKDFGKSI